MSLPAGAVVVDYLRWQPSPDLAFFTAYVKVGGPADDLLGLVRRLGLHRYGEEEALPYLPTGWQPVPQVSLAWWDAGTDTPTESWARAFGVAGWIVAKLERGYLYAIVTDTGRSESR